MKRRSVLSAILACFGLIRPVQPVAIGIAGGSTTFTVFGTDGSPLARRVVHHKEGECEPTEVQRKAAIFDVLAEYNLQVVKGSCGGYLSCTNTGQSVHDVGEDGHPWKPTALEAAEFGVATIRGWSKIC